MPQWGLLRGAAVLCVLLPEYLTGSAPASAAEVQAPAGPGLSHASAARKGKVWTNEDLIAARTPADIYLFEKEAKAEALQMEGFHTLAACFAFDQPEGDAEDTQKEIDAALQSIRGSEQAVAQSEKALRAGPDTLKLRNELELAQRMSELNHARERLWTLQEHLQELQKPPSQTASAPPPANSPSP